MPGNCERCRYIKALNVLYSILESSKKVSLRGRILERVNSLRVDKAPHEGLWLYRLKFSLPEGGERCVIVNFPWVAKEFERDNLIIERSIEVSRNSVGNGDCKDVLETLMAVLQETAVEVLGGEIPTDEFIIPLYPEKEQGTCRIQ